MEQIFKTIIAMKKFYLLVIFCLVAIFTASAEPVKYHFMYMVGDANKELLSGWFILDREKMTYKPESDSEVFCTVKNYKKSGNKESFEVWEDTFFVHRAEIVTDKDGQMVITHYVKGEQGEESDVPRIIATEAEWEKAYEEKFGKKPYKPGDENAESDSPASGVENAKNKVVGGVKNAFNKTKDVFKKKDKGSVN